MHQEYLRPVNPDPCQAERIVTALASWCKRHPDGIVKLGVSRLGPMVLLCRKGAYSTHHGEDLTDALAQAATVVMLEAEGFSP